MSVKNIFFPILAILAFCIYPLHAQEGKKIDSLKHLYYAKPESSNGALQAVQIAKQYNHQESFDSAMHYLNMGIATAKKLNLKTELVQLLCNKGNIHNLKGDYNQANELYVEALKMTDTVNDRMDHGKLLNNIGIIAERQGNYSKAYRYFTRSLQVFTKLDSKKDISSCYNNIALIYHDQSNNAKAIEYNLKALAIEEKMNEPYVMANTQNNIGGIYHDEKDDKQALEYYSQAMENYKRSKSKKGIASTYDNIGIIYVSRGDYEKGLEYYNLSLPILQEMGAKEDMANCYSDIGGAYFQMQDISEAIENDQKALDLYKEIGDQDGTAQVMNAMAKIYYSQEKYAEAIKTDEQALAIALRINAPDLISGINQDLSIVYEKTKQADKAYIHFKAYVAIRDSLNSEENSKKIIRSQLAYQFEKEQQAQALEDEKKDALEAEAARRQRAILYFVIGILVLVLVFVAFLANRFIVISKQKKTIEEQKTLVDNKNKIIEEKNKDITDSINYARDIQKALLPNDKEFREIFPESFVLYLPKDIVSGDFYWMSEKDGKTFLLAADCTGHGVPGALMSMIGVSLFNETLDKKDIIEPGHILTEVRSGIINTFRQKGDTRHKDGMDAALCCFDRKTLRAQFAGAYNPLWVVSKSGEVKEISPDKQPIGIQDGQKPEFTTQAVQLEKGDTLYMFSDGYADQFGGPNGKKFKYKQFQDLLLSSVTMSMLEQRLLLEKKFNEWKGNLEQVDDVLVIGIRV